MVGHDGRNQTQRREVPDVTVGDHFERVAVVYESLRTTDEAPVRRIGQLLPGRPVTGLDIGCGTGRYTRLLRALLPDGSRLAASDVSAAMLAQLNARSHGHADGVVPLLSAAEELPLRTASLDVVTAFNCVHHFDLARFLTAVARVLQPGGELFIYPRTPPQNARTIWGRYFPGFTEHEQRLHAEAALRDAVRQTGGLQVVATQTFRHPRSSTAGRLRAQAEGRHYSTFSLYPPDALHASIATFLARLPGPEVCWVDEHLLVVVGGRRRNQAEPNDSSGLASQAIKDPALQISAGHAGEASGRPLSLATRVMIEKTRNLVQPAGAAVLAAPQAVRGPEGGNRLRRRQHRASAADGAVARSEGLTAKQMPVEASNPAITATRVLSIRPCPSGIAVDARLYQREGETAGADRRPGLASRPHPSVTAHVPGSYEGR